MYRRRKLAPLAPHHHDRRGVVLEHGELFVRPLQTAHGGDIFFARSAFERVEDRERFPAGLLPLALRSLHHAAVFRFDSVTQSFVLLLGRVALGFVAASRCGGHALEFGVGCGSAGRKPSLNFRARFIAGLLRRAQALQKRRLDPRFFVPTLAGQLLKLAHQLDFARVERGSCVPRP